MQYVSGLGIFWDKFLGGFTLLGRGKIWAFCHKFRQKTEFEVRAFVHDTKLWGLRVTSQIRPLGWQVGKSSQNSAKRGILMPGLSRSIGLGRWRSAIFADSGPEPKSEDFGLQNCNLQFPGVRPVKVCENFEKFSWKFNFRIFVEKTFDTIEIEKPTKTGKVRVSRTRANFCARFLSGLGEILHILEVFNFS